MITQNADPIILIYRKADKNSQNVFTTPIPIYLSEEKTGLAVESEDDSLQISTDYIPVLNGQTDENGQAIKVQQKGETQQTTITLVGIKKSIGLSLLLPLMKTIMSYVFAKQEYKIAYFHGNVLIFNARLASYRMTPSSNDNKVTLTITLEVLPDKTEENKDDAPLPLRSDEVQTEVLK